MSHRTCGAILVVLGIAIVFSPAWAGDNAQVTAAAGDLKNWVQAAPSPIPGYCEWTAPDGLASFHATSPDGTSNMGCPHAWVIHADADSLSFNAEFPAIDGEFVLSASYQADLSCRITFANESAVAADRSVSGDLSTDEHTVVLAHPDGAETVLLAAGIGPDQGIAVVAPGTYEIRLRVQAWESGRGSNVIEGYSGRVAVTWSNDTTVSTEPMSWGSVKATYGP